MSYWPEILIKGSALDLSHLSPFAFECSTPGDAKPNFLTVNVRYSNHVFSEEFDAAVHAEDTVIWDHKKKRAFCQERYDLSFELPRRFGSSGRSALSKRQNSAVTLIISLTD